MSKTALVSRLLLLLTGLSSLAGCTANAPGALKALSHEELSATTAPPTGPSSPNEPRGLAIDIEDGAGVPALGPQWADVLDQSDRLTRVDQRLDG